MEDLYKVELISLQWSQRCPNLKMSHAYQCGQMYAEGEVALVGVTQKLYQSE
mgnify:CR=1 FL=1